MNRGTIRTQARRKLDELTEKFWDDDDLNDYINEGYFEYWKWLIEANHPGILKETTLNIVANVRQVALPSDYLKTRLVERVLTDGTTRPMTYKERFDSPNYNAANSGDGYIPDYRFVGGDLIIEPTPIGSIANGIRMTHVFQPPELTDDSQSPNNAFHILYHNMLVLYVVVAAKEKEEALGLNGVDFGPIASKLQKMEEKFKENIETESLQRQYTEPYGTDDSMYLG